MRRWLLVFVYAAIIFYLSSRTGGQLPRWPIMAHDKLLHSIEYAGFAFLIANAIEGRFGRRRIAFAIVAAVAFGALDEFHQTFVPGRSGNDLGDLSADLAGAALGTLAFYGYHRLRQRVK